MKKIIPIVISILIISSGLSIASYRDTDQKINNCSLVKINTQNAISEAIHLSERGYEVLSDKISNSGFELIVNPHEFKELSRKGYNLIVLDEGRPFEYIQQEIIKQGLAVPPGYLDLTEIIEEMNSTEDLYPDICKVYDLTEKYDVSPTYEGRHIYAMKISDNVEDDEDEPNFLMVSCHHAREIVTPVIALYAIEQFTTEYGNDPSITSAVNDYEIWISPVWNPDGYEYCYYVDNWWRKNRYPPDGVDLNRNYPFGWNSGCSGSTDPYSETYKGPSPASEAETQTMIAFTHDRHFAKVIDYHSYGREVLYGYACYSHPFSSFFQNEAIEIANKAGYGNSIRKPSAEGEHYEWQIAVNGSYANLMETHIDFQPSYASAENEAVQVFPATKYILERPISVSGHVVDSITGIPIQAEIILEDITFTNDEEFYSEPDYGRYHLFLPAGTYNIRFQADNYKCDTYQITVTSESAEILEVELERYNEVPYAPIIDGSNDGIEGGEYELDITGSDPESDNLFYYVDWGDQTSSEWIGPFTAGEKITLNHGFTNSGQYTLRAKSKDVYGDEGPWSDTLSVTIIENMCPNDPKIKGLNRGSPNVDYTFTFSSNDPESHQIYYYIDWGDGDLEDWIGPYDSGESVDVIHQWSSKAKYKIQAKAKDEYGAESDWSEINMNIPKSKFNYLLKLQFIKEKLIRLLNIFIINIK